MKGIAVYLAVFLFTLYWFFLFDEEVLAFMLSLEVVYFLPAVFVSLMAKKNLNVTIEKGISTAEKNQNVPIRVPVKNKFKMLPIHFRMYLAVENTLTGEKAKIRVSGTVRGKHEKTMTIPISANNCGNMLITIEKVKVYDLLMIMGMAKKTGESTQVRILPEIHLLPVEVTRKTREFIADADEYSDRESGDDPSEVYQIREYTIQDSVHDIHWKMSAKLDKLLVKEHGKAMGSSILIWINTYEKNGKKHNSLLYTVGVRRRNNEGILSPNVLEIAASFSLSLFEASCVHTVAWYEPENGMIRKKRVSKEIHVYELLNRLALIKSYEEKEEISVKYQEEFRGERFRTIVEIKVNGEVTVNGEPLQISKKKGKIEWEKLGFIV